MPKEMSSGYNKLLQNISDLPDVILQEILTKAPLSARVVNKKFANLADSAPFWNIDIIRCFPFYSLASSLNGFKNFQKAAEEEYGKEDMEASTLNVFFLARKGSLTVDNINAINLNFHQQQNMTLFRQKDRYGLTFLDWLVIKNNQALLNEIYKNTLYRNYSSSKGSLLHWAINCHQSLATIQSIKENSSVLPKQLDKSLRKAAQLGDLNVVNYLLSGEQCDSYADKVLIAAANGFGHKHIVDYLLNEFKFSPDVLLRASLNAVRTANCGRLYLVKRLLITDDKETQKKQTKALLNKAACCGSVDVVNYFLDNYEFDYETISLIFKKAIESNGHVDIMRSLLVLIGDNECQQKDILEGLEMITNFPKTIFLKRGDCFVYLYRQLNSKTHEQAKNITEQALYRAAIYLDWKFIKHIGILARNRLSEDSINVSLNELTYFDTSTNDKPKVINWLTNSKNKVFEELDKRADNPLLKAQILLQYCTDRNDSNRCFPWFFNKKNDVCQKVITIIKKIDHKTITTGEELIQELQAIKPKNETDEFARIRQYIGDEIYPDLWYSTEKKEQSQLIPSILPQTFARGF